MVTQHETLRDCYSREGYVFAKKIFTGENLSLLADCLRAVLEQGTPTGCANNATIEELILKRESQDHSLVYKAAQAMGSSAAACQLLGSSRILDAICSATGFEKANLHMMPMYLIIQLPSDERFDYTWHQDGAYYPWCQNFLTLWFPVNRSTTQMTGTISVIPGSHQAGIRETETFLKNGFFKQMQSKLEAGEEAREEILDVELGDCCIMSGNAVHRSVANRCPTPRVAGVLRIANLESQQSYERERFYCVHKS